MEIFDFIMFIFPVASFIIGTVLYFITRKRYIAPLIVAAIAIVLSYTIFPANLLGWAIIYAILAYIPGAFIDGVMSIGRKIRNSDVR